MSIHGNCKELEAMAMSVLPEMVKIIETSPQFALGLLSGIIAYLPDLDHPIPTKPSAGDAVWSSRRQMMDEMRYIATCHARDWARLAHPIQLETMAAAALNAMPRNMRNQFLIEAGQHFEGIDSENS